MKTNPGEAQADCTFTTFSWRQLIDPRVKNGNNSNGVNADNKNNDNTEDKSDDKEMVMTVDELVSGALESAFWAMDKLILRDKEAGFRIRHVK